MTRSLVLFFSLGLLTPNLVLAGPDDDLFGSEDEDEEDDKPTRIEEDDDLNFDEDEEEAIKDFTKDDDEEEGDEEEVDLLGEEEEVVPDGADTAAIYRAAQDRLGKLGVDEQIEGWDNYLAQYPNSVFKTRISGEVDALMEQLYGTRIKRPGGEGRIDALKQEVRLAHPMMLKTMNPRTRLRGGFDWGLPDFMNLFVDYEHQLARTFSVHGGLERHRLYGWSAEPGARFAFVKSTRTQTVASILADFHIQTNPAFPAFRPQLAIGKIFGEDLHMMAQAGPDFEFRSDAGLPFVGGANITYKAAETVAFFAETRLQMKSVGGRLFRFNTVGFGMKFFPGGKNMKSPEAIEVNMGAAVPYTVNYWQDHFGSISTQANAWLDDM